MDAIGGTRPGSPVPEDEHASDEQLEVDPREVDSLAVLAKHLPAALDEIAAASPRIGLWLGPPQQQNFLAVADNLRGLQAALPPMEGIEVPPLPPGGTALEAIGKALEALRFVQGTPGILAALDVARADATGAILTGAMLLKGGAPRVLVGKMPVADINPRSLRREDDAALLSLHLRLHQLFAGNFVGNDSLFVAGNLRREDLVNAEMFVQDEMERRGFEHEVDDELSSEVEVLRDASLKCVTGEGTGTYTSPRVSDNVSDQQRQSVRDTLAKKVPDGIRRAVRHQMPRVHIISTEDEEAPRFIVRGREYSEAGHADYEKRELVVRPGESNSQTELYFFRGTVAHEAGHFGMASLAQMASDGNEEVRDLLGQFNRAAKREPGVPDYADAYRRTSGQQWHSTRSGTPWAVSRFAHETFAELVRRGVDNSLGRAASDSPETVRAYRMLVRHLETDDVPRRSRVLRAETRVAEREEHTLPDGTVILTEYDKDGNLLRETWLRPKTETAAKFDPDQPRDERGRFGSGGGGGGGGTGAEQYEPAPRLSQPRLAPAAEVQSGDQMVSHTTYEGYRTTFRGTVLEHDGSSFRLRIEESQRPKLLVPGTELTVRIAPGRSVMILRPGQGRDEWEHVLNAAPDDPGVDVEKFDPEQPRDEQGRFGSGGGGGSSERKEPEMRRPVGERAKRALATHKPSTKEKQRIAKANAIHAAQQLGGQHTPDNWPMDIEFLGAGPRLGVEVKSFLDQKNSKVTMHSDSLARKIEWGEVHRAPMYTLVIDDRDRFQGGRHRDNYAGNRYYVRQGVGSFELHTMTPCTSWREVREFLGLRSRG